MNSSRTLHRLAAATIVAGAIFFIAAAVSAQSIGELNSMLSSIQGEMGSAESNTATGKEVVEKLDKAEALFAQIASSPKSDKSDLPSAYSRLDSMLNRIYETYKKKKDECIDQQSNGSQCDYTEPEQISLAALYPLSWLRFQGATSIYANDEKMQRKLLNDAIDGFTESTLAIFDPGLQRENVLGRAYCERELGKFDKGEYDKAIEDFKSILAQGSGTQQYNPAKQGLATTYMAMGKPEEAQKFGEVGKGAGGLMFHLQTMFAAENATNDSAKKAQDHAEIVSAIRATEDNKTDWAVSLAAVGKYCKDPVREFGNGDAFEKWLLANVLFSVKKDSGTAARYFVEAARGDPHKYGKGYKEAAAIYESQHRYDLVQQMLGDIERQGGSDAAWATYMKYKLPFDQWDQGGRKNTQLEGEWTKAANDYLGRYSNGENAAEIRFRLGENEQTKKNYLEAAKYYGQVTGNPDYVFTAKFNLAECDYLALSSAAAETSKNKNAQPTVNVDQLRSDTMKNLREAIKLEPEAERNAGGQQHSYIHTTKGKAIYMLAGLLQSDPNSDPREISALLDNYENQYPAMKEKFRDVEEWRIVSLSKEKRYDDVQRDLASIIEKNKGNTTNSDFIKQLGIDFWHQSQAAQIAGDQHGYIANAKLTATAYAYFEDLVAAGKMPAKNLTGTLSILADAYMAIGDEDKGQSIYQQVVKADPASPQANAGLAKLAQQRKDYKDAVNLWTTVESTAPESDDLWYEAKYNLAVVYSEQGNVQGACQKLAQTRAEHPGLGTKAMADRWNALQRKLCLDHQK